LEERRLSRHLERCASCHAFAISVAEFTNELREAPLAAPENSVSPVPRMRRRRPRVAMRVPLVAVMSAAGGILIASFVLQGQPAGTGVSGPRPPLVVSAASDDESTALREFHILSVTRLADRTPPPGQSGTFTGGGRPV